MLEYYVAEGTKMVKTDAIAEGAWIYAVAPNDTEISYLCQTLNIEPDFVRAALDEEERSRIEIDDNNSSLILIDSPIALKDENNVVTYSTIPVGIIFTSKYLLTVCLQDNTVLNDFAKGFVRGVNPAYKSRTCFQIMLQMATRYMQYLRQIDKITDYIEKRLHKDTTTNELVQMLDLKKSLVYLSTSLKNSEMTLSRIERGKIIKLYEDDRDLLEDVIIEYKQAREMADVFTSVLSGTIETFSSVMSNNLNMTMKKLTTITILLTIPTMIASFYGMNIGMEGMPLGDSFWSVFGIAAGITAIVAVILYRKKMF